MGQISNPTGKIGEGYFIRWHSQIMKYSGHQENVTVLKDVRENIAYTVPVDIDFIITKPDGEKVVGEKVAFHEVKYFAQGLERGNIYLEEVKNTAIADFDSVRKQENLSKWEKPAEGEYLEYLPDTLEYQYGAGWIYKNMKFHPDFYHICLPAVQKYPAISEELEQMQKQAKPGAKLITEAPTGIWISMEHNAMVCLYQLAKADVEYAKKHGKNNRYKGNYVGLNFSTSLVMKVQEAPVMITIEPPLPTADGNPLKINAPKKPFILQIRPLVKCITPERPDEETIEVMETTIADYYIPKRLLAKCMEPNAYKLYTDKYPSQHDCKVLAEQMQTKLIKSLALAKTVWSAYQ